MAMTSGVIVWLMIEPRPESAWTGAAISLFQAIILGYLASSTLTKPKQLSGGDGSNEK